MTLRGPTVPHCFGVLITLRHFLEPQLMPRILRQPCRPLLCTLICMFMFIQTPWGGGGGHTFGFHPGAAQVGFPPGTGCLGVTAYDH